MRRLFCLLLLICLPLQSFAAQADGIRIAAAGVAHLIDHAADVHHHHHDDGEVHYDDSAESRQHSHDYSTTAQPLLPDAVAIPFSPILIALADPVHAATFIPDPYLDDPQRPPAFAPGLAAGG